MAPGTFGSAVGVLLFLPLASIPVWLYGVTLVALVFLGIWASDVAESIYQRSDDGRIVIDEVAGQLITLAPLLGSPRTRSIPWLVTGFVLFRLFDIWKPGPVRRFERIAGGAGVMLDDVAAGVEPHRRKQLVGHPAARLEGPQLRLAGRSVDPEPVRATGRRHVGPCSPACAHALQHVDRR